LLRRAWWGDLTTAIAADIWNSALKNWRNSQAAAADTSTILGLEDRFIPRKVVGRKLRNLGFLTGASSWSGQSALRRARLNHLRAECNAELFEVYTAHARSLGANVSSLSSPKGWRWLANAMMMRNSTSSSAPLLPRRDNSWATTCEDDANLFA
jgi:hypothetical protein